MRRQANRSLTVILSNAKDLSAEIFHAVAAVDLYGVMRRVAAELAD